MVPLLGWRTEGCGWVGEEKSSSLPRPKLESRSLSAIKGNARMFV
jgi:hypothetical protein